MQRTIRGPSHLQAFEVVRRKRRPVAAHSHHAAAALRRLHPRLRLRLRSWFTGEGQAAWGQRCRACPSATEVRKRCKQARCRERVDRKAPAIAWQCRQSRTSVQLSLGSSSESASAGAKPRKAPPSSVASRARKSAAERSRYGQRGAVRELCGVVLAVQKQLGLCWLGGGRGRGRPVLVNNKARTPQLLTANEGGQPLHLASTLRKLTMHLLTLCICSTALTADKGCQPLRAARHVGVLQRAQHDHRVLACEGSCAGGCTFLGVPFLVGGGWEAFTAAKGQSRLERG